MKLTPEQQAIIDKVPKAILDEISPYYKTLSQSKDKKERSHAWTHIILLLNKYKKGVSK